MAEGGVVGGERRDGTGAGGFEAGEEYDRQLAGLLELGYPRAAGMDREAFAAALAPLRDLAVARGGGMRAPQEGRVPFLLVVARELVPVEETMPRTALRGGQGRRGLPGFVDGSFEPGALERFVPVEGVGLPDRRAYLLFDVERGEEFCGAVPERAVETIAGRGRTPLTIEEGIALVTHFPAALAKNKCFSLGASRCGDRRVPALWISRRAPKLGWCWAGNPHTWLGMASAAGRSAA